MAESLTFKNLFRKGRWILLIVFLFLLGGIFLEKHIAELPFGEGNVEEFQEEFLRKEKQAGVIFSDLDEILDNHQNNDLFSGLPGWYYNLYEKYGLSIFIYKHDSLHFWSDNRIPVPASLNRMPDERLNRIGNSIFVRLEHQSNDYDIIALILIKNDYPYENKFLKSSFQEDFTMDPDIRVVQLRNEGENAIYDSSGEYLFSLDMSQAEVSMPNRSLVCISLYLMGFILFMVFLRLCLKHTSKHNKNTVFFLYIVLLAGIYYIFSFFRLPEIVFDLELFSAGKFARSAFLPSLGDLLLLSVFGFFLVYNFYTEFYFNNERLRKFKFRRYLAISALIIISLLIYLINAFVFRSIILDSTISFETYRVLNISVYTFLGLLILLLLFATFGIVIDKLFQLVKGTGRRKDSRIVLIILIFLLLSMVLVPLQLNVTPEIAVFYSIIVFLVYFFRFIRKTQGRFSTFVIYVLLFSIFTVFEVVKYTELKNRSEMKMMAVNLSAEHDPVAELLLVDIDERLKEDQYLKDMLYSPAFDFDEFYTFFQRKYFNGFWDKYDLQITICSPYDSVYVNPPEDNWYHCYNFFYEYILEDGIKVPNTDFYYLDNLNGRISYFSDLCFEEGTEGEVTVFLELDSRLISEGLGYPELLLEDRLIDANNGYSYAKYNNDRLITSSGEFAYATSLAPYTHGDEGFEFIKYDGYDHKIYNIDNSNTIIVSKPSIFWVDILISFSYMFSFYFILLVVLLMVTSLKPASLTFRWNFRNKINAAMTSLLLVSLLLIGAGTVYFSIRQYRDRHREILDEKIQSVYVELIHKLESEKDLHSWSSENYYHLNELLQKFSNVFFSDINLFDENGQLLATSRPEIFEMGLLSNRMNAEAYRELSQNRRSEFIHRESVGKLTYLSAYVPFVNSENKLLAYLNLPYFSRQDELTREVTNLVVAIINIVVLLSLLSFTIAVILSNRLTHPLSLLQENLARISLSERNEKIQYQGKDEIASLVNQYNLMVEQLLQSAELLAKSERESAWREMAKQIAHEIKNPLTPMKLGIQHLQRIWKEAGNNKEEQVDRITKTLIEQIDNLSAIATEFSNFAKMPLANNTKLNIVEVLKDSVSLFEDHDNYEIHLELNAGDPLFVYADKEQLNRVFINLIKNGIQSIPENRKGIIEIILNRKADDVVVTFKDNGKGIHPDIRDKLFQPNFTTKSSGMGMGLAIVQNIIRNAKGNIYYETELNKGTSFHVQLPLIIQK